MTSNPTLTDISDRIRSSQPPKGMTTRIVAIDGLGGSGKSTLAKRLAKLLPAPIIATDDFASPTEPLNWDDRLMAQVLAPLAAEQSAHYQRYDWHSDRLANWITQPPTGVILLEGVSSSRTRFRPYLALSIWVDAPQPLRLKRGLERDGVDALPMWQNWQAEEDAYVTRETPMAAANVVVNGALPIPK